MIARKTREGMAERKIERVNGAAIVRQMPVRPSCLGETAEQINGRCQFICRKGTINVSSGVADLASLGFFAHLDNEHTNPLARSNERILLSRVHLSTCHEEILPHPEDAGVFSPPTK